MNVVGAYKHTQVGWVMLGIAAVVGAVLGFVAWQSGNWLLGAVFVVSLLPLFFFSTMTTTVADGSLRIRFGSGILPPFETPLASIRSVARVRTTVLDGWGIHWTSSGCVYNISGFDAVALSLSDGRMIRVGTDEPDRLIEAIREGAPVSQRLEAAPGSVGSSQRLATVTLVATAVIPTLLIVGVSFYVGTQPVKVTYSRDSAVFRGAGYSDTIPFDSIESISLEPQLPARMRRTNGFSAGGSLRGNFRISDSKAHVFVERQYPPFVAVRTKNDYVLVNFKDRSQTEQLYANLKSAADLR